MSTDSQIRIVADVVAAYFSHNSVSPNEVKSVIREIEAGLGLIGESRATNEVEPASEIEQEEQALENNATSGRSPDSPAVPIKNSVSPDKIICLEDGIAFKSLKRHLRTKFNMTPEQYRAKWGLPSDYPMVAPNYAKVRSDLAKALGLGHKKAPVKKTRARKAA